MRFVEVIIWLAVIALAAEVALLAAVGPTNPRILGWKYGFARQIGEEVGVWFLLLAIGTGGAGIAALINRKRRLEYPGLPTGATLIVVVAALILVGRNIGL